MPGARLAMLRTDNICADTPETLLKRCKIKV
jgi:hypothetical protein